MTVNYQLFLVNSNFTWLQARTTVKVLRWGHQWEARCRSQSPLPVLAVAPLCSAPTQFPARANSLNSFASFAIFSRCREPCCHVDIHAFVLFVSVSISFIFKLWNVAWTPSGAYCLERELYDLPLDGKFLKTTLLMSTERHRILNDHDNIPSSFLLLRLFLEAMNVCLPKSFCPVETISREGFLYLRDIVVNF